MVDLETVEIKQDLQEKVKHEQGNEQKVQN